MAEPVTFDMVDAWLRHPIPYELREVALADLTMGYRAAHAYWSHKPYEKRSLEHRQDYDRLEASIKERGILRPLICYTAIPSPIEAACVEALEAGCDVIVDCETTTHILIGMRCAEIGLKLGIERVMIADIREDVSNWWTYDVDRLSALKRTLGEIRY